MSADWYDIHVGELVHEPGRWNYNVTDDEGRILCCGSVVAASREEAFAAAERARDATIAEAERWMRRAR